MYLKSPMIDMSHSSFVGDASELYPQRSHNPTVVDTLADMALCDTASLSPERDRDILTTDELIFSAQAAAAARARGAHLNRFDVTYQRSS